MSKQEDKNIIPFSHLISRTQREEILGYRGGVFWLTGLSGAGKSTLAMNTEAALIRKHINCLVLDGDNVRHGLNKDLGFSHQDRSENIRRVAEVASLASKAGIVCIASFISPFSKDRETARQIIGENFHEIYVQASIDLCASRDPKGLYQKARMGILKEFTGISSPYEEPQFADIVISTGSYDIDTCTLQLLNYIETKIKPNSPSIEAKIREQCEPNPP